MKTKQMALTLMFFACFALLFAGCKSMSYSKSWTKTTSVKFSIPKDKEKDIEKEKEKTTVAQEESKPASTTTPVVDPPPPPPQDPPKNTSTRTVEEHNIKVSVDPRSTPLTWDIVNNIRNAGLDLRDLDYSLSKSFAMTLIGRKDTPQKLDISERVLRRPQEQSITRDRMEFTPEHKGALSKDMGVPSETFVIVFKVDENEIPLTFKRNSQGRYDLNSAMIDADQRTDFVIEDDPPQLCILSELNEHLETLAILNSKQAVSRSWQSYEKPAYQKIPAGGSSRQSAQPKRIDDSSSSRQFDQSRRIDDPQSYVTREGVTRYVRSKNPHVDLKKLSELFDLYKIEAGIEGISPDIAIAQMLYATDYLRNRMTTHNYAGLSTDGVRWDGKFPRLLSNGMTEGVRAHIQHLKGYVSADRPVRCVDPRYDMLAEKGLLGQVKTIDGLFRAWSQNPAYGNEINRILDGLYRSSGSTLR